MLKKVELLSDGTLVVNTNKYDKVKRVLIRFIILIILIGYPFPWDFLKILHL